MIISPVYEKRISNYHKEESKILLKHTKKDTTNNKLIHCYFLSFETVAVARNVEDLPNERVVSLAPPASSDAAERLIPASIQKSLCGVVPYIHIKGCLEFASQNAGFMALNPLYYIIGRHSAKISVQRGK